MSLFDRQDLLDNYQFFLCIDHIKNGIPSGNVQLDEKTKECFSGLFSFFVTNFITRGKINEKFSLYTCSLKKEWHDNSFTAGWRDQQETFRHDGRNGSGHS